MKGFPPLEILVVAVLFAAALVPLLHLTGEHSASAPVATANTSPAEEHRPQVAGTIRFSHPPTSFTLTPDDQPATSEAEFFWRGHPDGCELHLTASWHAGTPTVAIEITVEPEGIPTRSTTLWADNPLDELVTFSWPAQTVSEGTR
jgi:hypothetical protein